MASTKKDWAEVVADELQAAGLNAYVTKPSRYGDPRDVSISVENARHRLVALMTVHKGGKFDIYPVRLDVGLIDRTIRREIVRILERAGLGARIVPSGRASRAGG